MAAVAGAFPYDIDHLLGGRVRVVYAPITEDLPTNILDVHDMVHPYAVNNDWVDLGATRDSSSYSRSIDSEGYEIQQATGTVLEEITEVARSLEVSIGEIRPETLQIVEEAASIGTITSGALKSAQKEVKFGAFNDVTHYRVGFIAQRSRQSGVVVEPTTLRERGRFVALFLYNCTISADESQMEFEKGNLVHAPLTFTTFPEGGEDAGEEYGTWFFENAGTIASS